MNQQDIERIITLNETDRLDFKSKIDLETRRGQIDFLVEVLGLANTEEKPTYLVLGVQDSPRKVVGVDKTISEERLQKFINDNLKNPLHFYYDTIPYKRKKIGVMTILGNKRPYALKKAWDYSDNNGKMHRVSEKQVQVRRGSTGDIATIEEVIEMATERADNSDIAEELSDISSSINRLSKSLEWPTNDRDRSVEYIFVGTISAVILTVLHLDTWPTLLLSTFLLPFLVNIIASALKIVRFGLVRSLGVGFVISVIFLILSDLEIYISSLVSNPGSVEYIEILLAAVKGIIGGFIADQLISRAEI